VRRSTLLFLPLLAALVASALPILARGDAPPAGSDDDQERQKIERLISSVQWLKDATFVRNGTEYNGKTAAEHVRTKWKAAGSKIKTARDFIRLAASKSSRSGKPYLIRFKDGREVESETYLTKRLEEIEKQPDAK
jgi:hypothetical protein